MLGITNYLQRIRRFDMSIAVLLAFDSQIRAEDIRSLTYGKVIFKKGTPRQGAPIVIGDNDSSNPERER